MARERPSVERLRCFAEEHLLYEAGMLYEITGKLMNRHHRDDQVVENALLESFGIHNRSLIDFLWQEQPMRKTDAIARDWIEDWRAPEMSGLLKGVKDRVGKEMLHLSYNRLDVPDDEKGWTVLGIGPEVIGAFLKFVTEAPRSLVPENWTDRAYAATGAVPRDLAETVEKEMILVKDLRPEHFPSVPTQGFPPSVG
jgi:hypothetical protein